MDKTDNSTCKIIYDNFSTNQQSQLLEIQYCCIGLSFLKQEYTGIKKCFEIPCLFVVLNMMYHWFAVLTCEMLCLTLTLCAFLLFSCNSMCRGVGIMWTE